MSKLDTNHVINLDLVKDRVNSVIKFGLADVETSDFFVGLYNNGSRVFDKDYIVTLYIVKPNGTFRNIKLEPKEGLKKYYCNLPDTLKNIPGEYVCQAMVFDNLTGEKKISKSKFKYSVSVDLASEMAGIIDEEEQESILTNILNRLLTLENPVEPYATQKHVDKCVSTLTEEIDTIKVKDVEQDERLVNIESKNTEQDNRLTSIEAKDVVQDGRLDSLENRVDGIDEKIADTIEPSLDNHGNRLDALETKDIAHESRMANIESKNIEQDERLTSIEGINTTQDNRLNALESKDITHESRMTNIESKNIEQDERLSNIETKNTEQDSRLDVAENRLANIGNDITNTMQPIIDEHTSRLDAIEAIDVSQNNRLDAIEAKNQQQDDRLLEIEKTNKKQDIDIKCLYGASQTIDVTKEGNSIYLQNSNNGFVAIDEVKGNTLVNCNKELDKELILNGNINTSGDNTVTITEGVDGGLVDVALEGNTLVNASKTKDSTAITKAYTVENSGNHVALQGEYDGKCRPVVTGNTLVNLWKDTSFPYNLSANEYRLISTNMFQIGKTYSFILNVEKNTSVSVNSDKGIGQMYLSLGNDFNALGSTIMTLYEHEQGVLIKTYTIPTNIDVSLSLGVKIRRYSNCTEGELIISNLIILEGDYTNKPIPEYFTGLQSSFEDNLVTQEMVNNGEEEIDNLGKYRVDYKVTGKNKLNPTNSKVKGYLSDIGGTTQGRFTQYAGADSVSYIYPCLPNTTYTVSHTGNTNTIAEFDKYPINGDAANIVYNRTLTTSSTTKWLVIYVNSTWTDDDLHAQLEYGDTATSYEPYKEYTKTLYLNSPLLEGDTIEEKDGGIYHVHRSEEVVFDGTEAWGLYSRNPNITFIDTISFQSQFATNDFISMDDTNLKCNLLPSQGIYSRDIEGISKKKNIRISINKNKLNTADVVGLKNYLSENNIAVVYPLETPTYELIEQSNLVIPSYANGHLDFSTAVPVEKVDFLPFSEELTYLYANTQYTVQFVSDKAITADVTLGGTPLLAQSIVAGLNRISITTPSELVDNKLIISGVGSNISEVVVTDTNRKFKYFEGMKSVGECERLEIVSGNVNLIDIQNIVFKDSSDYTLENNKLIINSPKNYQGIYYHIPVKRGVNYTICCKNISNGVILIYAGKVTGHDANKYKRSLYPDAPKKSVAVDEDYITIRASNEKNVNIDCIFEGILVYEGMEEIDYIPHQSNTQQLTDEPLRAVGNAKDKYVLINGNWYIERKCGIRAYQEGDEDNYKTDLVNTVYPLEMPTYEEIDYNPLEVYSGTTHITTNSTIPTNITVKNHGFNCLLKPNTTYTISSNLGLNTVTTPSVLTEDCLRFMDTDTSDITTMRDVLVLEGDWTTKADLIPANFSGIESAFEQEYDAEKGKYKVNVKVANEDKSEENNITFYIDEPLRGTGTAKDRVYVKDDKVVVQRNCGSATFDGSEDEKISTAGAGNASNIKYSIKLDNLKFIDINSKTKIACNNFNYDTYNLWVNIDKECVSNNNEAVVFRVSKLKAQNVAEFKQWLQANPTTVVYQLAEPTYEEVEYNDIKLFIESFKNSTLFYNSNVPVTSTVHYSYSVPIVDTVAQTANISDEQDTAIASLAYIQDMQTINSK